MTLESEFPVVIETPVAWGEMDAMGHVNNIIYFRYFESARLAYFERVGFLEEMHRSGIGPILASTECRFRWPLTYPDTIQVGASVTDIVEDRFTMTYRIHSLGANVRVADGEGVVVSYDYGRKKKTSLPDSIRQEIERLQAALSD